MAVREIARVANGQNVTEPKPWDEALLALTKPGKYGLPWIVFFSEIAWLDLEDLCADIGGWHALQHGERGSAEAGVGLACREPIDALPLIVGSRPTNEGDGGVRLRPITCGIVRGHHFGAVHAPPPDSPNAREDYINRARLCPGTLGGDWNRDPAWMRRNSTRAYRGDGVLGILTPSARRPGAAETVAIKSDHLAVDVPLWLPERRRDAA